MKMFNGIWQFSMPRPTCAYVICSEYVFHILKPARSNSESWEIAHALTSLLFASAAYTDPKTEFIKHDPSRLSTLSEYLTCHEMATN